MSFEEDKRDVSSQVSTPDSTASTQICGFEVNRSSRPGTGTGAHRRVHSGELLTVKGSSLLSRQLRSPASSSDESPTTPKLRIRTPRRRLSKKVVSRDDEAPGSGGVRMLGKPAARGKMNLEGQETAVDTMDAPFGTAFISL